MNQANIPDELYELLGKIAVRHANLHNVLRTTLMVLLELESPSGAALVDGWSFGRISQSIRKIAKVAVVRDDHLGTLIEFVDKADELNRRRNRLLHSSFQVPIHHPNDDAEIRGTRAAPGDPWQPELEGVRIEDLRAFYNELDEFTASTVDVWETAADAYRVMQNQADRHYGRALRHPGVETPEWSWQNDE